MSDPGSQPPAQHVPSPEPPTSLVTAVEEVEQHVAAGGWDSPRQIFALVRTEELLAHEPGLIGHIGGSGGEGGSLSEFTPVEQEKLPGESITDSLAKIVWPDDVSGCVMVLEIIAESEEQHAEGRLAVGVLRDHPGGACALRWRHSPDGPVVTSPDLAPDLVEALHATFES